MATALNNIISVDGQDNRLFVVNNSWQFRLPDGVEYFVDSTYDDGMPAGGINLAGNQCPLVLKGLQKNGEYIFQAGIRKHYNFFGQYKTVDDCRYDNRSDSDFVKKTFVDSDKLYVDMTIETLFPFGISVCVRVRQEGKTPFNIESKIAQKDTLNDITNMMDSIAKSISLVGGVKPAGSTISPKDQFPNCVVKNGVLTNYKVRSSTIVLPEGIKKIGDSVFSGWDLVSITIPEGVTVIGQRAFENCFNLVTVNLPVSLKSIGDYAFSDCHKLKYIQLSDNITAIGGSAFTECFELGNIHIPNKLKSIDCFTFKNCKGFTRIVLSNGIKSIGASAFAYCDNLQYLYIPASVKDFFGSFEGAFIGCDKLFIHGPAKSMIEKLCKENGIHFQVEDKPSLNSCAPPSAVVSNNDTKVPTDSLTEQNCEKNNLDNDDDDFEAPDNTEDETQNLSELVSDLNAQLDELNQLLDQVIVEQQENEKEQTPTSPIPVNQEDKTTVAAVQLKHPEQKPKQYVPSNKSPEKKKMESISTTKEASTPSTTSNMATKRKINKKKIIILIAVLLIIAIIPVTVVLVKNAPYMELRSALNNGSFSSEWKSSKGKSVVSNYDKKSLQIVGDKLSEYHKKDDVKSALSLLTELMELDINIDGKYFYASSSFIDWIKSQATSNGTYKGTDKNGSVIYDLYGYTISWHHNRLMNQFYLFVPSKNNSFIVMVNNGYYKIDSSKKAGIE